MTEERMSIVLKVGEPLRLDLLNVFRLEDCDESFFKWIEKQPLNAGWVASVVGDPATLHPNKVASLQRRLQKYGVAFFPLKDAHTLDALALADAVDEAVNNIGEHVARAQGASDDWTSPLNEFITN